MSDFTNTATGLIEAVGGEVTEENIKGVCLVLNAIQQTADDNWQDWIDKDTEEAMAFYKIGCPDCGAKITVTNKRKLVEVGLCH